MRSGRSAAGNQAGLFTPLVPSYAGGAMFQRYVSFGNSITAGIQSGGLNDSLQKLAYPVLLARAMGTPFFYPSINYAPSFSLYGCPPPITFIFSSPPTRLGPGSTDQTCSLRGTPLPPFLNNVAFPGADVLELLNSNYAPPQPPASATDAFKLFLLGGRTASRGGGGRHADDDRLLGYARNLRYGDTQHARHSRAVQRDHRAGRDGAGLGVCGPERPVAGPRRCSRRDSAVPSVPPRPERDGGAIRNRDQSRWHSPQHLNPTPGRPSAAGLDQRPLQRPDPPDSLSANRAGAGG